jgi:hypothetical protein
MLKSRFNSGSAGAALKAVESFFAPKQIVLAHCDLPCGVYDPSQAKIEALSVKAAMEKYGQAEARIASMYLIVGPHCLQRKTKLDSNANDLLLIITTLMPSAGTKKLGCLKS